MNIIGFSGFRCGEELVLWVGCHRVYDPAIGGCFLSLARVISARKV
jgi:hypothetical protein